MRRRMHRGEGNQGSGARGPGFGDCVRQNIQTSNPQSLIPNPSYHSGIILLIVLALLAMFGLIGITFVIVASQAQRSAKSVERIDLVTDPPKDLLHQAALQVFRGPAGTASVMGAHNLLDGIYGNDVVGGTMTGAGPVTGFPQLVDITQNGVTASNVARRGGCVLTITGPTTSPCFGQSTRIVGVNPTTGVFQIMAFPQGTLGGDETFIINGVPFSGTGFGYDATSHSLDSGANYNTSNCAWEVVAGGTAPVALLPNLPQNRNPEAIDASANSDYTAADFQHMILAAQVWDGTNLVTQTLPSMHRPALVRYWANKVNASTPDFTTSSTTTAEAVQDLANDNPELLRAITLRPLPTDHPYFTGSNPTYIPVSDPLDPTLLYQSGFNPCWDGQATFGVTPAPFSWDVDNDGDGVTDSVWVDLGFPVRTTSDGRQYKPLFAILCVDLDGRLNLNAHGSLAHVNSEYYNPVTPQTPALGWIAGVTGNTASLPRGLGYGPAEINLNSLITDPTEHKGILVGRYGSDGVPGRSGLDPLSVNRWFSYAGEELPNSGIYRWWGFLSKPNYMRDSFGSPPDPFGQGAVALDVAGRPLYMSTTGDMQHGMGGTIIDNPYELDLGLNANRGTSSTAADTPFSLPELERILRPYDSDAPGLPARLAALAPSLLPTADPAARLRVTTESWDIPCPAVQNDLRISKLLTDRGIPESYWGDLLPPEMLIGLKMNINRPFGNGRSFSVDASEADNVGVVDDPTTPTLPKQVTLYGSTATTSSTASYDGINVPGTGVMPPGAVTDPLLARQRLARNLYVLMFLVADRESLRNRFGGAEAAARAVAQWAINAVSFRDRSNVMIPFDYDPEFATDNPLSNGWNPPVDKAHRVWSCKKPELLITETLAFHDRNTSDTDQDTSGKDHDDGDPDYDQSAPPEGSLFVELYNPSSPLDPPSDAVDQNAPYKIASGGMGGQSRYASCVRLDETTPNGDPVWRLLITITDTSGDANEKNDPEDPVTGDRPEFERCVYFGTSTTVSDVDKKYLRNPTDPAPVPILPGSYAVIGPRATTFVGKKTDDTQDANTRRIVLTPPPTASPNPHLWNQVTIENNKDTSGGVTDLTADSLSDKIKPPVAVIIDGMNVSEPTDPYPTIPPPGSPCPDTPFDMDPSVRTETLNENGTMPSYRMIHLQRLADPRKPWSDTMGSTYNPYVTIDSQPVDLTVFNGNYLDNHVEPNITPINSDTLMFATHQRGETNETDDGNNNLWKAKLDEKSVSTEQAGTQNNEPATGTQHNFPYKLRHTLGYLNDPFGAAYLSLDRESDNIDPCSTSNGWLSTRGDPANGTGAGYGPFPWLTWNNRPYVSPLELMQVSWLRPSQLLRGYNVAQSVGNCYTDSNRPFPHLLNVFLSGNAGAPNEEIHRILEYLYVPSPFVGTEAWANPAFAGTSTGHAYHPPFNGIPAYREPGKINLNTIYSENAFRGLMGDYYSDPLAGPTWSDFVQSRRGSTGNILDAPDSDCPTEFAHPFRSFGGASLVPTLTPDVLAPSPNREVNATLLREGLTAGQSLVHYSSTNAYEDTNRNPYFRYQILQRLGNLVTTRSNVYAVWITIGYFEVLPAPNGYDPAVYPDGYQLGRELGMDTGEIERHRAFYIFDRTIPVGFVRGQDLNVEKAILVKRYVE